MGEKELPKWLGHTPRDRGSIWYLAPLMGSVAAIVIVAFIVATVIFA